MRQVSDYLHYAVRSILSHRLYSIFYILGTAAAFILILLLLSATRLVSGSSRPFVNADNTIYVSPYFNDIHDRWLGGIETQDIGHFVESVPGAAGYCIKNIQYTIVFANEKVRSAAVDFVDSRYFEANDFDFISGRAFTDDSAQQAVLLESFAERCYKGDPVGETITIQKTDYRIVGVVKDFSVLQNPDERAVIWVPYTFDKFIPSGGAPFFDIGIVFEEDIPAAEMKENLCHAVRQYFSVRNKGAEADVRPADFKTIQEKKYDYVGGSVFGYGAAAVLLLLLLVPALNIMALSSAKISASAREMAIRRALGATSSGIFRQLLTENILLSAIGFVLATILAKPCLAGIDSLLFRDDSVSSVLDGFRFDFHVYALSLVLVVLFALIAGGVPAYRTSRKNIANELKGRDL